MRVIIINSSSYKQKNINKRFEQQHFGIFAHQTKEKYSSMANVHGFRDMPQNNRNQNRRGAPQNYNQISDSIPFMTAPVNDRPPLQQTIPYTLKMICCPTINPLSISVILSVIMAAFYVFCCFQGITKKNLNILEIDSTVLLDYGAVQDLLVKKGQVYRLITASLLHMNLLHIVMNLICFVFLLSRLQKTFNFRILLGIIFASSVSGIQQIIIQGNILSVLCNKTGTISAGASGIIFGVIGAYLCFMTINWQTLAGYGEVRSQLCCTIGILVFFSILFSIGEGVDMYGHFGGMIGGYLVGLALLPGIKEKYKKFVTIGGAVFVTYLLVTFLVFFLTA